MKTSDEIEELQYALKYFNLKELPEPLKEGELYEIALAKVTYTNFTQSYIAVYPSDGDSDRDFYYAKTFAKDKLKIVQSVDEFYPVILLDKTAPEFSSPYKTIKALYDDKDERQDAFQKYQVTSAKKWNSMDADVTKELIHKLRMKNIRKKLKEYEDQENKRLKHQKAELAIKRREERLKAEKEYNLKQRRAKG